MELSSYKMEDYIPTKKAFSKTSNLMINNGYLINNKLNSPKRQWISPINKSFKTNRTTIISKKTNKTIINLFIKSSLPETEKKMLKMKTKETKARQKFIDAPRSKKLHNLQIPCQAVEWCLLFHRNQVEILIKDNGIITIANKLCEIVLPCIPEEEKNYDISNPNIFQPTHLTSALILHIYQEVIIVNYQILSFFCSSADLEVILKISKSLGLFRPTDWKVGSLYKIISTSSLRKNSDWA